MQRRPFVVAAAGLTFALSLSGVPAVAQTTATPPQPAQLELPLAG